MSEKAVETFECWLVGLKSGEGYIAHVVHDDLSWNTLKFASYAAALAWCRKKDKDPRDFVINRVRFTQPEVLETREIDYSISSLMIAPADSVLQQQPVPQPVEGE